MPVKNDIPKSSIMIKLIVKTRSRMTKRNWKKKRKENGKTRNYTPHYWRARESEEWDLATLDLCVNAWVMVPVLPGGWLENSNEHESESRIIIILLFIFAIRYSNYFKSDVNCWFELDDELRHIINNRLFCRSEMIHGYDSWFESFFQWFVIRINFCNSCRLLQLKHFWNRTLKNLDKFMIIWSH